MILFPFRRRVRHPFFPDLPAEYASKARGRVKALAGSFEELIRAAERGVEVRRAVFALTNDGDRLPDAQRDELWRRFQVPVFAMVLRQGRPAAWECETQRVLHVAEGGDAVCDCGRMGVAASMSELVR